MSPIQLTDQDWYQEVDQGDPATAQFWEAGSDLFTNQHVLQLASCSGYGKASGPDGLTKELLGLKRGNAEQDRATNLVHPAVNLLSLFFQLCMVAGTTPTVWNHGLIVPI